MSHLNHDSISFHRQRQEGHRPAQCYHLQWRGKMPVVQLFHKIQGRRNITRGGLVGMNQTLCSNLHALHFTPIEEKPSLDPLETLSPATHSFCIFKRGQLAITDRQHWGDFWALTGQLGSYMQAHFRKRQMTRTFIDFSSKALCGKISLGYCLGSQLQNGPSNTTGQDF